MKIKNTTQRTLASASACSALFCAACAFSSASARSTAALCSAISFAACAAFSKASSVVGF